MYLGGDAPDHRNERTEEAFAWQLPASFDPPLLAPVRACWPAFPFTVSLLGDIMEVYPSTESYRGLKVLVAILRLLRESEGPEME